MSRSLTISALLPALALAALAATGCSGKAGTGYGSASPERGADYSAPAADPGQSLGSGASFNEGGFSGETAARDAAPAPATAQEESADMDGDAFAQSTKKRSRPGLGTAFGEQRQSQVRDVSFQRDNPLSPDVILSLRYNDAEGVRELGAQFAVTMQEGGDPRRGGFIQRQQLQQAGFKALEESLNCHRFFSQQPSGFGEDRPAGEQRWADLMELFDTDSVIVVSSGKNGDERTGIEQDSGNHSWPNPSKYRRLVLRSPGRWSSIPTIPSRWAMS